jgi:hypothetical protein
MGRVIPLNDGDVSPSARNDDVCDSPIIIPIDTHPMVGGVAYDPHRLAEQTELRA